MTENPHFGDRDAYLNQLKSELIDPKPYKFEGTYGKDGNFQLGSIDVDKEGKVVGFINDFSSPCDMHIVKGKISTEDNYTILEFDKLPTTGLLVNIHYFLGKPTDGSLEGKYNGMWNIEEEALTLDFKKLKKDMFYGQAQLNLFKG